MSPPGPLRPLSARQREIAEGIADGLSYAEIGAKLGISPHTVSAHVRMLAAVFDVDRELSRALAPRQVIYTWMMFERFAAEHRKTA